MSHGVRAARCAHFSIASNLAKSRWQTRHLCAPQRHNSDYIYTGRCKHGVSLLVLRLRVTPEARRLVRVFAIARQAPKPTARGEGSR